jgi:hypothetical protein
MARDTTARRKLRQVFKQLDDDDRERVLDFAEQLAGASSSVDAAAKSLTDGEGKVPSYTAAVDPDEYKRRRADQENQTWG